MNLVFGKADFRGVLAVEHVARNGRVLRELFLLRQEFERDKAAASGHHFECAARGLRHLKVLQQAMRLDTGGELGNAVHGPGFPHIGR
jgi:hypothetical protein